MLVKAHFHDKNEKNLVLSERENIVEAVLIRKKNWYQFWISSKPKKLIENRDYKLVGSVFTLMTPLKKLESVNITYEYNPTQKRVR